MSQLRFKNITSEELNFSRSGFLVQAGETREVEKSVYWDSFLAYLVREGKIKMMSTQPARAKEKAGPASSEGKRRRRRNVKQS